MADVPAIQDHAAIGDGRSVALVARDGTIDWLCWPRVESPAVFASLLDPERGGAWSIGPTTAARVSRRYLPDTNVLETRHDTASGTLVVTDAMTVASEDVKRREPLPDHELLRIVACTAGEVDVVVRYAPKPDYGRARVRLTATRLGLRLAHGSELYTLRGDRPLAIEGDTASARFTLAAGDRVAFSLCYDAHQPALLVPLGTHAVARMARTTRWWQDWIADLAYDGTYRDAVARSMLAVKLLSFAPSGAIIAAPTTSLPETIGGDRNWDYRFCWLRDAAMTANAALSVGYTAEASAFCDWLLHTTRLTRPELRILYDVYGNLPSDERELPLAGYRGSRPVRERNAAATQLQLDCYGEVIDACYQNVLHGRVVDRETEAMLADFGRFVCTHWQLPDRGIWESRGAPRHYTVSKVLCWVALDRLIRIAERGCRRLPVRELAAHRDRIAAAIHDHGWNPRLASYTTTFDDDTVDASLLLLGWYGFERPDAPRMRSTWQRLRARLAAGPGLLYRYESVVGREGAFAICGLWAAELLARGMGTTGEARAWLDAILGYANDVGLLGEEIDPATGDALGNFPQAYSHVGVINAALALAGRALRQEAA
ncbi:MAG TPA: glycoside hydrolase family 15 protein [Kofleriaceae bacterium]|nr:glycoside hydrolase family 15 protein [Kofleriaceae bacterium]